MTGELNYLAPYDEQGLQDAQQRHQDLINSGVAYEMPEAECRALGEQYLEVILEAKAAMRARGVLQADFPTMFNELLRKVDEHQIGDRGHELPVSDLADPPKLLSPGAYWYTVPGRAPAICEKREGEDFVRFTNGSRQSWSRPGESFVGPLPTPNGRCSIA